MLLPDLNLLYRQFYLNADSDTLHQFYLSCIRPRLEYACTVCWQERKPFWRQCKRLLAKYENWNVDYEIMLANMCMVSVISPKIFYFFIPPPTMTHVHLISLLPMLEQMLINIPSSHANVLHFWNSLPATPAQAPSSRPSKPLMAVSVVLLGINSGTLNFPRVPLTNSNGL